MKTLFLSIAFLVSFQLQAETFKLATVKSDIDKLVNEFILTTDHRNELDTLRYVKRTPDGNAVHDATFTYEEVLNGGVVLEEREGREVIRLEPEKLNRAEGGTFRLNYLYNGIRGTRKSITIALVKKRAIPFSSPI